MNIGIDFDNTIVSYDYAFYKAAVDNNLIKHDFSVSKIAIRNYLREKGKESDWTLLQGEVYGSKMSDAVPFPGVIEFIKKAQFSGHKIYIISHKTQFPISGYKYNLHLSATKWIYDKLIANGIELLENNIFFEPTKERKVIKARNIGCDVFIDDLPEILTLFRYNESIKLILFDPELHHNSIPLNFTQLCNWLDIENYLFK
jgi:hypothetical protein